MKSLRLLALLLDYPNEQVVAAREELLAEVDRLEVTEPVRAQIRQTIVRRCQGELYDWQAEYDSLFERGRSLSLFLFEHVHGESRDRGQAMVDLMQQYGQAGLQIDVRELPDYLPLYLEFLSTQGEKNARLGLQEIAHVLALLLCRLQQRDSDYAALFAALVELSKSDVDMADLRRQLEGETRDDSPQALDKVWEEEVVSFTGDSTADGCTSMNRPAAGQRRDQDQVLTIQSLAAFSRS